MNSNNVAILGGGAIALANSALLSLSGFKVNMFELPRFRNNIYPIIEKGGIEFTGILGSGFAKLNMVTTNVEEAIKDVDIIILATPAFSHEAFIKACAPYLQDRQIFLIETAYFGCLRFAKTIHDTGRQILLSEMNITPYTCTKMGPTHINIDGMREKDEVFVAALPAKDTMEVLYHLRKIFPGISPAKNVLQTSLDNCNWISHPPITLLHRGFIERTTEFSLPLKDSIPPSVVKLMEAMEEERLELGRAFELKLPSIKHFWNIEGKNPEEALRRSKEFKTYIYKYKNGSHQYLIEDLYLALPPIASLANLVDVPIPTINALIHIFSVVDGVDYMKKGVNVEIMGLAGLGIKEILKLLEGGY